jgi:hypothetical protein
MDEEIKSSLDALERRITATEKRFEDVKWYIGGASLIFGALTLVLGWNFSGDRKDLRDAVNDMKTDVRELEDRSKEQFGQAAFPQLMLLGPDARPLAGQQVEAEVHDACCGMGIREDRSLVISNQSRFVPHFFE